LRKPLSFMPLSFMPNLSMTTVLSPSKELTQITSLTLKKYSEQNSPSSNRSSQQHQHTLAMAAVTTSEDTTCYAKLNTLCNVLRNSLMSYPNSTSNMQQKSTQCNSAMTWNQWVWCPTSPEK
jgi:hypothetical protein